MSYKPSLSIYSNDTSPRPFSVSSKSFVTNDNCNCFP